VAECDIVVDRVLHPDPADTGWVTSRERLCERLEATRFPPGCSTVIPPVMFVTRPVTSRRHLGWRLNDGLMTNVTQSDRDHGACHVKGSAMLSRNELLP
jgi:hypothetical protein